MPSTGGSMPGQCAVSAWSVCVVGRGGKGEEVLEGVEPALLVGRGEFGTDVAQVPGLGDVARRSGGAALVAHDEAVLPGVLGHPFALRGPAEPADAAASRRAGHDVDGEAGLMLAVPGARRPGIRILRTVRADDRRI